MITKIVIMNAYSELSELLLQGFMLKRGQKLGEQGETIVTLAESMRKITTIMAGMTTV